MTTATIDQAVHFKTATSDVDEHVRLLDALTTLQLAAETRKVIELPAMPAFAAPKSIDQTDLVTWWQKGGESPEARESKAKAKTPRLEVDREAIFNAIDWLSEQDFAPGAAERIKREAWH